MNNERTYSYVRKYVTKKEGIQECACLYHRVVKTGRRYRCVPKERQQVVMDKVRKNIPIGKLIQEEKVTYTELLHTLRTLLCEVGDNNQLDKV